MDNGPGQGAEVIEEVEDVLYPIAVLLDELKNEDVQLRLNSTRRLKIIATALGPERTRAELLPFLTDSIDDEDEVLLALAEELGDFVTQVGGPEFASALLEPLETLSAVEETVVRERAVESIKRVSDAVAEGTSDVGGELHVSAFAPLVQRLAAGDWFTSRISACALFAAVFRRLPAEQETLRATCLKLFRDLSKDDTPMVRRAAASNLGDLGKAVSQIGTELLEQEIIPVARELGDDEQDSVRLLVVENAATIARLVPADHSSRTEILLPLVRGFVADKSWRVRYMVADQLGDLCDAFGEKPTTEDLLPGFIALLKDSEAEVRTAAAFKVADIVKRVVATPDGVSTTVREVIPVVRELVTDPSQHARAALASNIMGLAPELGSDATVNELLELVLVLLKDEYPEVRLNVIARLDKVSFVMGIDKLSSELLPAIVDLAEDRNWRVRLAIIEHIPLLARQLGKEFFDNDMKLGDLCLNWLGDCVFSIREAAIQNLKSLTTVFGVAWAKENIVAQIVQLFHNSTNYLYRMTALNAISVLAEVVGADLVEEMFLPVVLEKGCTDSVPNIRFGAAKTLAKLGPYVRTETRDSLIRPGLMSLTQEVEKDNDVRYYASEALASLEAAA